MNKFALTLIVVSTIAMSCKEVIMPLEDPIIPESDRVVLVEELTGASCPNCPKGTAALENLINKFPDRVLAVAIHGSFLSQPTSKSKFDFRNQKAKDLENWFKPWFGKPSASINRTPIDDGLMLDAPDLWQAEVEKELKKPHEMNIILKSKYDAATRKVTVDVAAIPLVNLAGPHKISVYLLESGIVDGQSNGSVITEDFKFNHVLMDMLTKHDGDALASDLIKGNIYNRTFDYTLPVKEGLFDPKRMTLVVMVNKEQGQDKHVIQAAEVHVIE